MLGEKDLARGCLRGPEPTPCTLPGAHPGEWARGWRRSGYCRAVLPACLQRFRVMELPPTQPSSPSSFTAGAPRTRIGHQTRTHARVALPPPRPSAPATHPFPAHLALLSFYFLIILLPLLWFESSAPGCSKEDRERSQGRHGPAETSGLLGPSVER